MGSHEVETNKTHFSSFVLNIKARITATLFLFMNSFAFYNI